MVDVVLYALGCLCAWILGANHGARWGERNDGGGV